MNFKINNNAPKLVIVYNCYLKEEAWLAVDVNI